MTPFLRQAAAYCCRPNARPLGSCCFVFPNRRAAAFFRKHLKEEIQLHGPGRAQFAPQLLTVNDFFYKAAGVRPTDRIQLLIELYDCYRALNPKAEPLDEFIFWGDILLGDFDDIDKYRVDAKMLLANVADLKAIQDDFTYLTDAQREAIESFLKHFRNSSGVLTVDIGSDNPQVKERFLSIWNILYRLYSAFRESLRSKGMAYEGMVYRDLADRLDSGGESAADILGSDTHYVFIGLNALNECEKTVLTKMRNAGLADFLWDYVSDMIRDRANKSTVFMDKNIARFPMPADFRLEDNPRHVPDITVISVPSATGQAKLLPGILEKTDRKDPVGTAIVLPDETLLTPVLNSIPPEWQDINVTMGYPLGAGAIYTLLDNAAALQLSLRLQGGKWFFYHRPVTALLSGSLLRRLLTPQEKETVRRIRSEARYFIPEEDFQEGPLLRLIFRAVVRQPKERDPQQIRDIIAWLKEVLSAIGRGLTRDDAMLLELDLTKRCFTAVEMLAGRPELTEVLPAAWFRLLERLLAPQSVPFNGEPLKGLQVMGPLETRALDFRHLILLSANEGVFPRHSVSSSFIPPELRKGFGLPTYEFQDAVWAYYFYRMLQRAEKVWLIYDSRTEGIRSGEESRYIKQLRYHFRVPLRRQVALPELRSTQAGEPIEKTPETMRALHEHPLSASALNSYLNCPAKFYYQFVCRLAEDDEVAESLDGRMLGNVYHETMQSLYLGGEALEPDFPVYDRKAVAAIEAPLERLTPDYLEGLIGDKSRLRQKIHFLICHEMHIFDVSGRNLVVADVILRYVLQTLQKDLELARSHGGIRILGLERQMKWSFEGFDFIGYIDRMDSLEEGVVRILDYKTGKVKDEDTDINDDNAEEIADLLFGERNDKRPTIAFQLFLYDMFTRALPAFRDVRIENGIYAPANLFVSDPTTSSLPPAFVSLVRERLRGILAEIDDPAVPFRLTEEVKTCKYCNFKMICGR